jgi:F0F1-type ATP synthase assembly protein I
LTFTSPFSLQVGEGGLGVMMGGEERSDGDKKGVKGFKGFNIFIFSVFIFVFCIFYFQKVHLIKYIRNSTICINAVFFVVLTFIFFMLLYGMCKFFKLGGVKW